MNASPLLTEAFSAVVNVALDNFQKQLHFHVESGMEAHSGEGIVDATVTSSGGWTVVPVNHALKVGVVNLAGSPGVVLIPAIPA